MFILSVSFMDGLSHYIVLRDRVKVSKSQKQIMASWILPKNERWGNFQYIKLPQCSFFGRPLVTIIKALIALFTVTKAINYIVALYRDKMTIINVPNLVSS